MLGVRMVVPTLPVSDLDRAKSFYGDVLGLALVWESPASIRFDGGGGSELSVFRRPGTATEHTLAHFEVADIEAAIRDLESRGVVFIDYADGPLQTTGHIAQIGAARGAWLHDPDRNTLRPRQE